jgi:hypothetical protein
MKSKNFLLGILAIMLVFTMTAIGCDNNPTGGNDPQTAIFQGIAAGYKYVLTITENKSRAVYIAVTGDSYELRITKTGEADKVSKGTVSAVGADGTLTLQPETASSPTFSVSMNGASIAAITGSITLADGTTVTAGEFEERGEEPNPPNPPNPPTTQTFTTIAEMATWLAAQPDNTASTAYTVKLNVADLGGNAQTSGSAGKALQDNDTKFVSLDLSGSIFNCITDNLFNGCTSLTNIIFPNNVTDIDASNVFKDCSSLTSVTFQSTITEAGRIFSGAFPGDLRDKYLAGGIGTYTTTAPVGDTSVWTKQN